MNTRLLVPCQQLELYSQPPKKGMNYDAERDGPSSPAVSDATPVKEAELERISH